MGLIVRNEENDLPACLASFIPSVDFVCLIDTGSTDKTVEIARDILEKSGIQYHLGTFLDASDKEGRICDFAKARNEYVKRLELTDCDYLVSVDADDTLTTPDIKGAIRNTPADFYGIRYRMNPDMFFNSYKIWRNGLGVRYDGRVHECLGVQWDKVVKEIPVEFLHHFSTNPGQETGTERNMRILRAEIYPPLRSLFYWANENVDCGRHHEAIKWYIEYIRRVKEGEASWPVELAHCYFRAARWCAHVGRVDDAVKLSLELVTMDPSWSESWCELAHIARCKGQIKEAKEFCLKALSNRFVPRLFSEIDKYTSTPAVMLAQMNALTVPTGGQQ